MASSMVKQSWTSARGMSPIPRPAWARAAVTVSFVVLIDVRLSLVYNEMSSLACWLAVM